MFEYTNWTTLRIKIIRNTRFVLGLPFLIIGTIFVFISWKIMEEQYLILHKNKDTELEDLE